MKPGADKIPVLIELDIADVEVKPGTFTQTGTKIIWPDPKKMNFTLERRDPFSTLTEEEYDRRKKK